MPCIFPCFKASKFKICNFHGVPYNKQLTYLQICSLLKLYWGILTLCHFSMDRRPIFPITALDSVNKRLIIQGGNRKLKITILSQGNKLL